MRWVLRNNLETMDVSKIGEEVTRLDDLRFI